MDDKDMFDELYQLWSNTTGAEKTFWMPVEYTDGTGRFKVYSVDPESDKRKLIASELRDEDAEFIAGIHGVIPDIVRMLHEMYDEAARADFDHDDRECRIFELELENSELKKELYG